MFILVSLEITTNEPWIIHLDEELIRNLGNKQAKDKHENNYLNHSGQNTCEAKTKSLYIIEKVHKRGKKNWITALQSLITRLLSGIPFLSRTP